MKRPSKNSDCATCAYHLSEDYCTAFINGIPEKILNGSEKHRTPIEGQLTDAVYMFNEELFEL